MNKKKIKSKSDLLSDLFSVVRFNEKGSKLFECIPDLWFTDDKKTACYWPPKGKSFRLRALNKEKPDSTWTISECIFVSGGYVTYNDGLSAAKEKILEQNTSSADDHLEAKNFRRKHPVLALSANNNFDFIFAEPTVQKNDNTGVEPTEIVNDDVNKSAKCRRQKAARVQKRSLSKKTAETVVMNKADVNTEPEEQSTQLFSNKSPTDFVHSRRLSSDHQLPAKLSHRTCSRSPDISLASGRSSSASYRSRRSSSQRSAHSSRSSGSRYTKSQGSDRSSRSSGSRCSNLQRSERSESRSDRSRSRYSSDGSRHSRSSFEPRCLSSQHSDRSRSPQKSNFQPPRSRSKSNSSSHGSSQALRSHSRSCSKSSSSTSRPQFSNQHSRTAKEHHSKNSNRNNRNSRSHTTPRASHLRRTGPDLRSIDAIDRRMTRMEVTINKIFVMVSDIIKHSNKEVRSRKENRAHLTERRPQNRFEEPNFPISRVTHLTVFNKMLKRKEVYSFMLEQEKDFCAPSKSSDNVVMTAYLKRFIAVELRCKIALKDTKGQKELTLFKDFKRVYNFLIDVMKSGYAAYNKRIRSTEVHTALRTVWGRSNQLLQDKNRKNYK